MCRNPLCSFLYRCNDWMLTEVMWLIKVCVKLQVFNFSSITTNKKIILRFCLCVTAAYYYKDSLEFSLEYKVQVKRDLLWTASCLRLRCHYHRPATPTSLLKTQNSAQVSFSLDFILSFFLTLMIRTHEVRVLRGGVSATLWPLATPFLFFQSWFSRAAQRFSCRFSPSDLSRMIFALGNSLAVFKGQS